MCPGGVIGTLDVLNQKTNTIPASNRMNGRKDDSFEFLAIVPDIHALARALFILKKCWSHAHQCINVKFEE